MDKNLLRKYGQLKLELVTLKDNYPAFSKIRGIFMSLVLLTFPLIIYLIISRNLYYILILFFWLINYFVNRFYFGSYDKAIEDKIKLVEEEIEQIQLYIAKYQQEQEEQEENQKREVKRKEFEAKHVQVFSLNVTQRYFILDKKILTFNSEKLKDLEIEVLKFKNRYSGTRYKFEYPEMVEVEGTKPFDSERQVLLQTGLNQIGRNHIGVHYSNLTIKEKEILNAIADILGIKGWSVAIEWEEFTTKEKIQDGELYILSNFKDNY
jgi:hypothetical protein